MNKNPDHSKNEEKKMASRSEEISLDSPVVVSGRMTYQDYEAATDQPPTESTWLGISSANWFVIGAYILFLFSAFFRAYHKSETKTFFDIVSNFTPYKWFFITAVPLGALVFQIWIRWMDAGTKRESDNQEGMYAVHTYQFANTSLSMELEGREATWVWSDFSESVVKDGYLSIYFSAAKQVCVHLSEAWFESPQQFEHVCRFVESAIRSNRSTSD